MAILTQRFLLFAYELPCDAYGGWGDYKGSFNTLEEAISEGEQYKKNYNSVHVVDLNLNKIVWSI